MTKEHSTIALQFTSARRHSLQKPEPKNIPVPPRVLTETLNWPNIPKKLAAALISKTCQFFISAPNGTSGCFWKRGTPIRKRTQSTSTLSFHVCTSISRNFRTCFSTRVMHICHLLAYFTVVSLTCIRN